MWHAGCSRRRQMESSMKRYSLCLIALIACGHEAGVVEAPLTQTQELQQLTRLRQQKTDITPATAAANAIPDDAFITPAIAWDAAQYNPTRIVCMASSTSVSLVGYADAQVVQAYLGP